MSKTPSQHPTAEQAVTVLMAVVPCGADTARRILADTARGARVAPRETAEAVLALGGGRELPTLLGTALKKAVDKARSVTEAVKQPYTRLLPDPQAIGELLKRHRSLRRRALAAPHDPVVRNDLDDATYTLCILMGQRNAHTALRSAELLLGAEWLGTTALGTPDRRPGATRPRAAPATGREGGRAGARQQGATGCDFP